MERNNGKKQVQEKDPTDLGNNPSRLARDTLPRKCKTTPPFYGVDILYDEEIRKERRKMKKTRIELGSSSGTVENEGQQRTPHMQQNEDNVDMNLPGLSWYDDCCIVCADGGTLICCENCPSTYHLKCIGLQALPLNEWHCPLCYCRFCDNDSRNGQLLKCVQCSRKYHSRCSIIMDSRTLSLQPSSTPFCGSRCYEVYRDMENIIGQDRGTTKQWSESEDYWWVLVRKVDAPEPNYVNDIQTTVAKLMEDYFAPILDRRSQTNMIQSIYNSRGSSLTRTNFSRFYTAVLLQNLAIRSAVSVRRPSQEIAEIAFIATVTEHRGKGMSKILLQTLEIELAAMGVRHILTTSFPNMVEYWEKFGFRRLDENMKWRIKELNTFMFPGAIRLQKEIRP